MHFLFGHDLRPLVRSLVSGRGGDPPLGGYPWLTCLFCLICDFRCLQIIHSRWVRGKFFFLNELATFKGKSPDFVSGLSLSSVSSIAAGG